MAKTKLIVEDQHLVALSCILVIYGGLDAWSIKQYLYKTYINLFMAGHASLMVEGKLLLLSMQIWCKQI